MASKPTTEQYLAAFRNRHSVYGVKNTSKLSADQVEKLVQEALLNYPSAYNYQPARVAVVTGDKHHQLWEKIISTAEAPMTQGMGADGWKSFEGRLRSFQNSYGTVAFFDDEKTIEKQQSDHKHIAPAFPQWADHANGIAQFMVWTAIELEGVGASLQHLNIVPPVKDAIAKELGLPESWIPKAQLVFGDPSGEWPGAKDRLPFSETLKVFK